MKSSTAYLSIAALLLGACSSVVPKPGPSLVQHDLGMVFESGAANSPIALRSIAVVAPPMINGVSMQYREAAAPTRRNAWNSNRWAAAPAAMAEGALNRLLSSNGPAGRCRLLVTLGEFIVDIDADGKAQAVVVADVRLSSDGGQSQQVTYDLRSPLARVDPAAAATAFRADLQRLGERSAAWLGGPAGQLCRG